MAAASSAASPEGGGAAVPGRGRPQLLHLVVDHTNTAVAAAGRGRPVDTGPAGVQLILLIAAAAAAAAARLASSRRVMGTKDSWARAILLLWQTDLALCCFFN